MADDGPIRKADDIGRKEPGDTFWNARRITGAVVIGVLVLFAVLNLQKVNVDFGVTSVNLSLIFVIVVCGAVGFGAGYLVRGRRDNRD
jgi:hypothetical protein